MMTSYRGVPLGELSPHPYAIAEQAYGAMATDEAAASRQAILISGESGAGKIETAKLVMQYLAARASGGGAGLGGDGEDGALVPGAPGARGGGGAPRPGWASASASASASAPIEEQVLESNPLLEAFGNAKTVRNDNSSRFGKFVEIAFDRAGRVGGATIATYLLERSRVVAAAPGERSYHIFYQLCAGASPSQRKAWHLPSLKEGPKAFKYLAGTGTFALEDVDDAEGLAATLGAMGVIGLGEEAAEAVLRGVAAVLHLGNIEWAADGEGSKPKDKGSKAALAHAAELLGTEPAALHTALSTRAIEMTGERIVKPLEPAAATESRDALAKTLYARLFDWLVTAINRRISSLGGNANGAAGAANGGGAQATRRSIGILDIYGFECFETNSFEQLCINLANERLQQQFNAQVLAGEQAEYAAEGVDWSYIDFVDNQDCLDLLEGCGGGGGGAGGACEGVFPLIDEACRLPRATADDLASALRTRLAAHPRFGAPKRPPTAFAVEHYAGSVVYDPTALLDKNRDFTVAEHASLMAASSVPFLAALFAPDPEAEEGAAAATASRGGRSAFKLNSVGAQFRRQLGGLMATLGACQPHYIRCIKPNPGSVPGALAPEHVLEQLRAGGVLEAVRIACAGFPTRKPFRPFVQRYAILVADGRGRYEPLDVEALDDGAAREATRAVLTCPAANAGGRLEGWQLGRTRVFLRAGQLAALEGARGRALTRSAVVIQSAWRGRAARAQLRQARAAATAIQARWRGVLGRRAARDAAGAGAALKIQAAWRAHKARKAFLDHVAHRRATTVQRYARGWLARARFRRATDLGKRQAARAAEAARREGAAIKIQARARGVAARARAAGLKAEAARLAELEEGKAFLEAQVAQLRARLADAEARAGDAEAAAARAASDAAAARLEASTSREAGDEGAGPGALPAAAVAELEAAQAAASRALRAEADLLRSQKEAAEEGARRAEAAAAEARAEAAAAAAAAAAAEAAAASKGAENARLWEQVRSAAEEYAAEFEAKEATIAALGAEAEASRSVAQAEIDALRTAMEAEVAAARAAMHRRVDEAVAEAEAKAAGLRDAREKNVHLSARVVALNSRVASLQKAARDAAGRERELAAELEALRAALAAGAHHGGPGGGGHANGGSGPSSPRALAAASPRGGDPWGALSPDQDGALTALVACAVPRRLPIVNIQHGATPGDAVGLPFAAWLLGECLLTWAGAWRPAEVDGAATRLRDAVLAAADAEGLGCQAYWLSATLALGALLKVRSIGRRDCGGLFKLGDDMIQFGGLHALLAGSVAEQLPVSAAVLLGDDAKRAARAAAAAARGGDRGRGGGGGGAHGDAASTPATSARSYEDLMASPWKGLLGGLSNVLEALRGEGAPPPACRAVVHAALRSVDAELLNALMLRRDCCSISAAKALQAGLADVGAWVGYVGPEWAGEPADAAAALARSGQAAAYLLHGKADCVRRAAKGFDVSPDLRRACPALTLAQVYRLTEHHHDDWIAGAGGGADTLALLRELKAAVDSAAAGGVGGVGGATPPRGGGRPRSGGSTPFTSPGSDGARTDGASVYDDAEEGVGGGGAGGLGGHADEEALLLDPHAAFVLPRRLLTDAARHYVQAPRPYHSAAPGVSLLDRIEACCRGSVALPPTLRGRPDFAFLLGTQQQQPQGGGRR